MNRPTAKQFTTLRSCPVTIFPDTEGTDDGVAIGDGKARPSIEKSADKSSAKVGDKITYILTLSNSETATVPVENAAVTDVIPAGLTFEYGSVMLDGSGTSDFTYDENTRLLTVNVGSIEPDTSRTVSFVATVNEDAYNTTDSEPCHPDFGQHRAGTGQGRRRCRCRRYDRPVHQQEC